MIAKQPLPGANDLLLDVSLTTLALGPEFGKLLLKAIHFENFLLKDGVRIFNAMFTRGLLYKWNKFGISWKGWQLSQGANLLEVGGSDVLHLMQVSRLEVNFAIAPTFEVTTALVRVWSPPEKMKDA